MSKNPRIPFGSILTAILCGLFLISCQTRPKTPRTPPTARPDATGLVARHQQKDTTVVASSHRIDEIVEASDLAEPVKTQTDQIRTAVSEAPAREVADVAAAFAKLIDTQDRKIAALSNNLDKERQRTLREQTRWLYAAGVALLIGFGIAVIFGHLAGLSYGWPLAALGAGCFGLAQTISHPYFVPGFTALCVIGLCYGLYLTTTQRGKSRKKDSESKILEALVPVLDGAYEAANEDLRRVLDRNIFDPLSSLFTPEEKATVHAIRADQAKSPQK